MRSRVDSAPDPPSRDHGPHTLRVWRGVVVGLFGDDVFVELGPRMQGVISRRQFEQAPRMGDSFEFTLRGQEEGLWALALSEARPIANWESMEAGSLVHARGREREVGALGGGAVVQGRVTRIEPFGVFVAFGHGMEGFVHVSNLSHDRVEDPGSIVKLADTLDLRVLYVKKGGKRIGLGL